MRTCVSRMECARAVQRVCVCVWVCDRDSNCSSPLLQKLLAWSALSQSEWPRTKEAVSEQKRVKAGLSLS